MRGCAAADPEPKGGVGSTTVPGGRPIGRPLRTGHLRRGNPHLGGAVHLPGGLVVGTRGARLVGLRVTRWDRRWRRRARRRTLSACSREVCCMSVSVSCALGCMFSRGQNVQDECNFHLHTPGGPLATCLGSTDVIRTDRAPSLPHRRTYKMTDKLGSGSLHSARTHTQLHDTLTARTPATRGRAHMQQRAPRPLQRREGAASSHHGDHTRS